MALAVGLGGVKSSESCLVELEMGKEQCWGAGRPAYAWQRLSPAPLMHQHQREWESTRSCGRTRLGADLSDPRNQRRSRWGPRASRGGEGLGDEGLTPLGQIPSHWAVLGGRGCDDLGELAWSRGEGGEDVAVGLAGGEESTVRRNAGGRTG